MSTLKRSKVIVLFAILLLFTPVLAASTGTWSTPVNLSGWHLMEVFRFTSILDGTQALFYPVFDLATGKATLWSRIREPDGTWPPAADLSGAVSPTTVFGLPYWDVGISPDGTVWESRTSA